MGKRRRGKKKRALAAFTHLLKRRRLRAVRRRGAIPALGQQARTVPGPGVEVLQPAQLTQTGGLQNPQKRPQTAPHPHPSCEGDRDIPPSGACQGERPFLVSSSLDWPKWRNGRRARLKIWYPQGCVGSSPTFGTLFISGRSNPRSSLIPQKLQDSEPRAARGEASWASTLLVCRNRFKARVPGGDAHF